MVDSDSNFFFKYFYLVNRISPTKPRTRNIIILRHPVEIFKSDKHQNGILLVQAKSIIRFVNSIMCVFNLYEHTRIKQLVCIIVCLFVAEKLDNRSTDLDNSFSVG
jgi:hypothetical protein